MSSIPHKASVCHGQGKSVFQDFTDCRGAGTDGRSDRDSIYRRSGQIFDQMLSAAGMSREEIYLTNIVKCRPPGNRDPLAQEQEACMPYLKYETLLIRPEMIICLGRIAAQRIIRPEFRITREHGTFLKRKDVWLTAVYHPSAVLRDPSKYDETVRDLIAAKKKLGS